MPEPTSSPRPFSEQMARRALESVRLLVEERGWDAPFSVYGLRCVVEDVRVVFLGEEIDAVEITLLGEGGHPFEDLPGLHLPHRFDAAILATEGWQYPRRLEGVHRAALELEGMPSSIPDRLENRLLTYLSRSGDSHSLLLTYENRATPPEEVLDSHGIGGRVQDAFRRFVGLPVEPVETVVHTLGRFWLGGLLVALAHEPGLRITDRLASITDPLETFMAPLRDSVLEALASDGHLDMQNPSAVEAFTQGDGGKALRKFALETISRFVWEDLRRAALMEVIDFAIPVDIVEWCDAGMFCCIVNENVSPQRELLDEILQYSPALAAEALEELDRRGWLEPALDTWPVRPPRRREG